MGVPNWATTDRRYMLHGTSSALLPSIMRDGFAPLPVGGLRDWVRRLVAEHAGAEPDEAAIDAAYGITPVACNAPCSAVFREVQEKAGANLFFGSYPEPPRADGFAGGNGFTAFYAVQTYLWGGELARDTLARWHSHVGVPLRPRFPDARPVVVEVSVPSGMRAGADVNMDGFSLSAMVEKSGGRVTDQAIIDLSLGGSELRFPVMPEGGRIEDVHHGVRTPGGGWAFPTLDVAWGRHAATAAQDDRTAWRALALWQRLARLLPEADRNADFVWAAAKREGWRGVRAVRRLPCGGVGLDFPDGTSARYKRDGTVLRYAEGRLIGLDESVINPKMAVSRPKTKAPRPAMVDGAEPSVHSPGVWCP